MEAVQKLFKKHREKHEIEVQPSSGIQSKVTNEIERRFNSAKRTIIDKFSKGIGMNTPN